MFQYIAGTPRIRKYLGGYETPDARNEAGVSFEVMERIDGLQQLEGLGGAME